MCFILMLGKALHVDFNIVKKTETYMSWKMVVRKVTEI